MLTTTVRPTPSATLITSVHTPSLLTRPSSVSISTPYRIREGIIRSIVSSNNPVQLTDRSFPITDCFSSSSSNRFISRNCPSSSHHISLLIELSYYGLFLRQDNTTCDSSMLSHRTAAASSDLFYTNR